MIQISEEDFGTIAICAVRYCQGRETYMPALVQGIVGVHLEELSDKDLGVLINDCKFQEQYGLYGDRNIDKPNWLKWRETLLEEKARREGN